jgi:FkbM family methyltransferase
VRQNDRLWKYDLDVATRAEVYEPTTIAWLRRVVRPSDCVIDVGANVGQLTLESAVLTGPAGTVIAVEPAPGNVRLLRRHVEANGMADRVRVVQAACTAGHGGQIELHICGDQQNTIGNGHTIRPVSGDGYHAATRVPTVSVDGLCREQGVRPAAIKIDVEGAELEVLLGAKQTLLECRPWVWFAFHPFAFPDPAAATNAIRDLLRECAYAAPAPGPDGTYQLDEYEATPLILNPVAARPSA